MDEIVLSVSEPTEIQPMPNLLALIQSKKGKISQSQREIMMGVTIEVNEIIITVETLPSIHYPLWIPRMTLTIKDVTVQSTDSKWEVVDLSKCKEVDPQDSSVTLHHKLMQAKSISLVLLNENNVKIELIKELPLSLQFKSKWKLKEGIWLGGECGVILAQLQFSVNIQEWMFIVQFFKNLKTCLSRPIPPSTHEKKEGKTKDVQMNYRLAFDKLLLRVFEADYSNGLIVEGQKLSFLYSQATPLNNNDKTITYESFVNVTIPQFSLKTIAKDATKQAYKEIELLSQQLALKDADTVIVNMSWQYLSTPITPTTPAPTTEANSDVGIEPVPLRYINTLKEINFNIRLFGVEVILDLKMWYHSLLMLFNSVKAQPKSAFKSVEPNISSELAADDPLQSTSDPLQSPNQSNSQTPSTDSVTLQSKFREKMKDQFSQIKDWNDVKIFIQAAKVLLILPIPLSTKNHFQGKQVHLRVDKVLLSNFPLWEHIPLYDSAGSGKGLLFVPPDHSTAIVNMQNGEKHSSSAKLPKHQRSKSMHDSPSQKSGHHRSKSLMDPSMSPTPTRSKEDKKEKSAKRKAAALAAVSQLSKRINNEVAYRIQYDFSDMAIEIIDLQDPENKETILQGGSTRMYTRYTMPTAPAEDSKGLESFEGGNLEIAFHSMSGFNVAMKAKQLIFFYELIRSYISVLEELGFIKNQTEADRKLTKKWKQKIKEQLKEKIESKVKVANEIITKSSEEEIDKQIDNSVEKLKHLKDKLDNKLEDVKSKVDTALESYKFIFFLRADSATISIPFMTLFDLKNSNFIEQILSTSDDDPLNKHLTVFSINKFELGIENSIARQNVMLRQKGLKVEDIDWPHARHLISVCPVSYEQGLVQLLELPQDDIFHFALYYGRSLEDDKPASHSQLSIQLKEMQIILKKKKKDESTEAKKDLAKKEKSFNIQQVIDKLVSLLDSKRDLITHQLEKIKDKKSDISAELKQNLQSLKHGIDLQWEIELGDCNVLFFNESGSLSKARNGFTLSNNQRAHQIASKFREVKHKTKKLEEEKQELLNRLKELEQRATEKDAAALKWKSLADSMEEKYVQSKLQLSQVTMELQDLQRESFNVKKKLDKK